jgi:hypothetical protein
MQTNDVEKLKAELEFYHSIFKKDELMDRIQNALGCTRQVAAAIKLFHINGEASNDAILHATSPFGRGKDLGPSYAKIVMWRVRQVFDKLGIDVEVQYSKGYRLTEVNWKKLRSKVK